MATAPPPPTKKPPLATPGPNGPSRQAAGSVKKFAVASERATRGQRIVIYGTGAIGKSSLAALAPKPLFIDLGYGTGNVVDRNGRPILPVEGISSFEDTRLALHDDELWRGYKTTVIDSGSELQDFAGDHVLRTKKTQSGATVDSIEGYGYGKGYKHVDEAMCLILADLDQHAAKGRNVILICHETIALAPNPEGVDFIRYEPDLQQPPKAGRTRDRVKNWCDHLFYIGYDKVIVDGKAQGYGSRTIYSSERPTFWAKTRSNISEPIEYKRGSPLLWELLFGKE